MQYTLEIEKQDGTTITIVAPPGMIQMILGHCDFKTATIKITKRRENTKNG